MHNGVSAWNQSPTIYSFTAHANDTWNYIDATYPGDTTYANCGSYIPSNAYGVTIYYDQFGNPSSSYQAVSINWTDVCLNLQVITAPMDAQLTTAHELGHTIGLAHNVRDTNSVMYPYNTSSAPDSNDTGAPSPGCPNRSGGLGGLGGGTMCIYGWGD